MGKKILFSAVSNADPISRMQDGPMLHLCRHERPDVVYLFLTKIFVQYHQSDDRYRKAIRLLEEQIGHKFEVHVIETDIEHAHLFDSFYDVFEQHYRKIFEQYGQDSEMIVNLSSGTAAMQACLITISVNSFRKIRLYQIPEDRSRVNQNRELPKEFQLEEYWELNMDNEPGSANRCLVVGNSAFNRQMQKEAIVEHILSYDYQEALKIADTIKNSIPEEVYILLKIACQRIQLKRNGPDGYLTIINDQKDKEHYLELYADIIPFRADDQVLLYEYLLYLRIKQKREEYAELARGITPLLYELSKYVLKNVGKVDIEKKYCTRRNGKVYLDRNKLDSDEKGREYLGYLQESTNSVYTTGFLASWQIISIIAGDKGIQSEKLKKLFKELRDNVEQGIRNIAAHTIVAVTDDEIKRKTGLHAEEIIEKFRQIFQNSGFKVTDEIWNSYDRLNEKIIQLIKM